MFDLRSSATLGMYFFFSCNASLSVLKGALYAICIKINIQICSITLKVLFSLQRRRNTLKVQCLKTTSGQFLHYTESGSELL